MSLIWLYVALGGFAGAMSRYAIIQFISTRFSTAFPYGTLTVNVIGSFVLGLLLGTNMDEESKYAYAALGIGYLGSFTTFSTYAVESLQMSQKKRWRTLLLYQLTSYGLSISAAAIGFLCGRSLT
ncbi:MAG: fluoride efflux transporter CrcB [Paenibacillaceae bacterium]